MSDNAELHVVLCWHMHQPQYKDLLTGEYQLPWTYLHAMKDYIDMAAHIESTPEAKAVVNFAPVLLDQLADYKEQVSQFLLHGEEIRDPLLAALVSPNMPNAPEKRFELMQSCLRVNRSRVIDRFPAFSRLSSLSDVYDDRPEDACYASDQFLIDLLVWYHLGWMAETVRRHDVRVTRLQETARDYSMEERRELLVLIGELLDDVIDRYRRLAEQGKIELCMTPYAHPIMPLLLDIGSAREAMPDVPLPDIEDYPGGRERSHWHMRKGLESFEKHFGRKPTGCWPAEGGVSRPALDLISEYGFRWTATGETVLRNSLNKYVGEWESAADDAVNKPYCLPDNKMPCFFRDDVMSDEIGFTYHTWHADDAVNNFIHRLEEIANSYTDEKLVLPIILDGENAWEHYPENGYYFLNTLYEKLAAHPYLKLSTFSECLDAGVEPKSLPGMVSGSWVYGTFSTWIGDRDKNRGWEMLVDAKLAFDRIMADKSLSAEQTELAEIQMSICEGSDWFWWFGDYNASDTVSDFEKLFRLHLSNLYKTIGVDEPEYLSHTFAHGSGDPSLGGVMRHGQLCD
ncbi:MAG: glycoside hydrolase family 57 protein [Gammaproteobacteria bacterium]